MSVAEGSGVPEERTGLRIRRRAEDDIEACLRILAEVHRYDGYPLNWPEHPGAWLSDGPLLGSWVAEFDGRLVGHIGLSYAAAGDLAPARWSGRTGAPPEAAAVVARLFVSPGARGHALGALLVGRAVEEAQRHGLHPVLDVLSGDAAAAALYERLGWELMDTVEQQWSPQQTVHVRCYAAPVAARWVAASARVSQKDGTRPVPPRPDTDREAAAAP